MAHLSVMKRYVTLLSNGCNGCNGVEALRYVTGVYRPVTRNAPQHVFRDEHAL
jgi:hypothetical protein